jgi:ribose-phosphate pyrophosphokinase
MNQRTLVFSLFEAERFVTPFCEHTGFLSGDINLHQFPDEESLVTFKTEVADSHVVIIACMDRPNPKMLPLMLVAETARALGATRVSLIAPYWVYMRQDTPFHPGEGVSSVYLARFISQYFDDFMTIEPHLHRWHDLSQIFSIPALALHIPKTIADWIGTEIPKPVLIGPDNESSQWVSAIAGFIKAPYLIVEKTRFSDAEVKATVPEIENYRNYTPVIVDDIISTAATIIETVQHLQSLGMNQIHCVGVHAIFAGNAYQNLQATGVTRIATCNTIAHPSNQIDVTGDIISAWRGY